MNLVAATTQREWWALWISSNSLSAPDADKSGAEWEAQGSQQADRGRELRLTYSVVENSAVNGDHISVLYEAL